MKSHRKELWFNVPTRRAFINITPQVVDVLRESGIREGLCLVKRSSWWRSAAWPNPSDPDYINGVALVETSLPPLDVLQALQRIEQSLGRERSVANAPRTIDLDLIAHGRSVLDLPELSLPHPRADDRLFVMGPLAEIAPDWTHPVSGHSARRLAASARIGADSHPITGA